MIWWNFWNNLPWKRRRRMRQWDAELSEVGLDRRDVDVLAIYNAERWRGVAHTSEHMARMAELQDRYNRARMMIR